MHAWTVAVLLFALHMITWMVSISSAAIQPSSLSEDTSEVTTGYCCEAASTSRVASCAIPGHMHPSLKPSLFACHCGGILRWSANIRIRTLRATPSPTSYQQQRRSLSTHKRSRVAGGHVQICQFDSFQNNDVCTAICKLEAGIWDCM